MRLRPPISSRPTTRSASVPPTASLVLPSRLVRSFPSLTRPSRSVAGSPSQYSGVPPARATAGSSRIRRTSRQSGEVAERGSGPLTWSRATRGRTGYLNAWRTERARRCRGYVDVPATAKWRGGSKRHSDRQHSYCRTKLCTHRSHSRRRRGRDRRRDAIECVLTVVRQYQHPSQKRLEHDCTVYGHTELSP